MTRPTQCMVIFLAFIFFILLSVSITTHLFPCHSVTHIIKHRTIHTLGDNSFFVRMHPNTITLIQGYVIMPHTQVNTTNILCKVKQFITEFLSVSIGYLEVFSVCLCLSLSNCLKTCLDRWQKNMYDWFHPDTFLADINFNIPFSSDKHSRNSRIISTDSLSWQLSFSKYRLFI